MFKKLILMTFVAISFGGSILASATPASAYLVYRFDTVSVPTGADDDDDDDDYGWLS